METENPINPSDKVLVGIRMPYEMFEEIQTLAQKEYNSISGICKKFISEGLAKHEEAVALQR